MSSRASFAGVGSDLAQDGIGPEIGSHRLTPVHAMQSRQQAALGQAPKSGIHRSAA